MDAWIFKINFWALLVAGLIAIGLALFFLYKRKFRQISALYFSDLSSFSKLAHSWKTRFIYLPIWLESIALLCLLIAIANPYFLIQKDQKQAHNPSQSNSKPTENYKREEIALPTEGIGIYFVLDNSGSMSEPIRLHHNSNKSQSRLEVLKEVTKKFIKGDSRLGLEGRKDDLIGLVSFARVAQVIMPLTLDYSLVLKELSQLKTVNSRDQDGTAIGYAIYKTVNTIAATQYYAQELLEEGEEPPYKLLNTVMVLVTDGIQNPNPLDERHHLRTMGLMDAAKVAKQKGIRLYIINVEPLLAHPQYNEERKMLEEAAVLTGGRFYLAASAESLKDFYADIDRIEKEQIANQKKMDAKVKEMVYREDDLYKYQTLSISYALIWIGFILLMIAQFLNLTLLKRIP